MFFSKKVQEGKEDSIINKQFQFIKGDRFNQVVKVVDIKKDYVIFEDESRVNKAVFDEFLVSVDTVDEGFSYEKLKPTSTLPGQNMNQEINNSVKDLAPGILMNDKPKPESISKSPILMLLEKQTPSDITFEVHIKAKVPNKALVDVLTTSFGGAETLTALKEYVFSQVDFSNLKDSLVNSIEKHFDIQKQKEDEKDQTGTV